MNENNNTRKEQQEDDGSLSFLEFRKTKETSISTAGKRPSRN